LKLFSTRRICPRAFGKKVISATFIIKAASSCLLPVPPVQPFFSLRFHTLLVNAVPYLRDRFSETAKLTWYDNYNSVATIVRKLASFELCHSHNNDSTDAR
jgi:hypothetical protein